jgi:hypothetical protein
MADSFLFVVSDRATTGAAIALTAAAVTVWAARTARPGPAGDDGPATAPRLPANAVQIGGIAAVLLAAAAAAVAPPVRDVLPFGWLAVLTLALAAVLRGYRVLRPGPPALDRLAAALAVVPACALLAGALLMLYETDVEIAAVQQWAITYAVAGALALAAGLLWRRPAPG